MSQETATKVFILTQLLAEARGYVAGNHDEGCELDPEFGEQNFERANDEVEDAGGDEFRNWPDDAKCTCGTDELLGKIDRALGGQLFKGNGEPVTDTKGEVRIR